MKTNSRATAARTAATKRVKKAVRAKGAKNAPAAKKKVLKSGGSARSGAGRVKRQTANTAANEETIREFRAIVNLDATQLEKWLRTAQSKKLERLSEYGGTTSDFGQKVLNILGKRRDKYNADDLNQMRAVIDNVNRRLAKRPKGDIVASNWRYSLMNWGHDPTKRAKRISK